MIEGIKVIGLDADDTLWVNEPYFRETEEKLREVVSEYAEGDAVAEELFRTETQNMPLYGYGVKAYILSVVETAIRITSGKISAAAIGELIRTGKEQLMRPVELLEGVEETLHTLSAGYRLILATKGDLLDQERKLGNSGIGHYFHHVEIMSDKTGREYRNLLKHIAVAPAEFLMVGNSIRSDVLPPLSLGCYAVHVPFHTTWEHEQVCDMPPHPRFFTAGSLRDIPTLLAHG